MRISDWSSDVCSSDLLGPGVGEGAAGDVKPHQLHHHLVAVGGDIEGAGARAMIARRLRPEQLVAGPLALGVRLADALLSLVRDDLGHQSCRNQSLLHMAAAPITKKNAVEGKKGTEHI